MPIKFKINVKGLRSGVTPAAAVAGTSPKKDCQSANHIAFEATPDCLFVNASNGRVSLKNPIPYDGAFVTDYFYQEGGTVTVKASDLSDVLDSFPDNEVLNIEVGEGQKPTLAEDASEDDKKAWETLTGTELRLRPESDAEQVQTLPILSIPIVVQSLDGKPDHSITVPRMSLCRAISRVLFAGGFEAKREKFLYWKLHGDKHSARYIAGSGSRFAIADLRGEQVSNVNESLDMLIPVEPSATVLKVFQDSSAATVTIKHFGNRIGFEADNLRIVCVGMNPNILWVDENLVLGRTNLYKFTVAVADLDLAVKGIMATEDGRKTKAGEVHSVKLSFDAEKQFLTLNTDRGTKKANRKVKLSSIWTSPGQASEIQFKCVAGFIGEVVKSAERSTHVQFELVSSATPMIVRFYGGEHVFHEVPFTVNPAINAEESFTMLVARLAEK